MAAIEENLRKLPPQNLEAEEFVLGGILLDNDACNRAVEIGLRPEDFYRESHRKIFAAMLELAERGTPVDAVTLAESLRQQAQLQAVGGASFIAELTDRVPSAANVAHHARIVKEKSILRGLISTTTDIATQAYDGRQDVEQFLDEAERRIFGIAEQKFRPSFFNMRDLLAESLKDVERLYERKEMITGVPTGFHDLDKLTAGLQRSDLIIVAGRPGMGKTALALNIATHAALLQTGLAVAIFSLEMSKEQLVLRMLCSEALVNYSNVRSGHMAEREFTKLTKAAGRLWETQIFIDDSATLSVLELRAKARRLMRETAGTLGLIVVDYLQLMRGSGRTDSREQEISEISRSLKALAKELRVPVVALSQLNRQVEARAERRPVMADLRESGAIEQDADVIAFIYREAVYNRNLVGTAEEKDAEIIIAKQRNGPTDIVRVVFRSEFMRFEDHALPGDEAYLIEAQKDEFDLLPEP
ncbi:MAG: replicative DNA helicase [Deltaproteobacteria bacterium]|nr:replicative DNA helicase [Deltaproteobacteria bacterium]